MSPGEADADNGVGTSKEEYVVLTTTTSTRKIKPFSMALSAGILLLGVSAMINSVDDWRDSRSQESRIDRLNAIVDNNEIETDCRAALAAQVGNLESERTGMLARGLVAVVQEDEPALQVEIDNLRVLEAELVVAREQRANAVELCDNPEVPEQG